jgi:hypothetical protein
MASGHLSAVEPRRTDGIRFRAMFVLGGRDSITATGVIVGATPNAKRV